MSITLFFKIAEEFFDLMCSPGTYDWDEKDDAYDIENGYEVNKKV